MFIPDYDSRPVLHLANPDNREAHDDPSWILAFGSVGTTYLRVWERAIEDALETAAEWLVEHAPGHIMTHDSQELRELLEEALNELRGELMAEDLLAPDTTLDDLYLHEEALCRVTDTATADLTYTESGYITSYEWTIAAECPTRDTLKAYRSVL